MLLLDEPLGALDLKLRQEMQIELKTIQQEVGITFIYVTHDQEEALAMSDRMAIFDRGLIEQVGSPAEVYESPATAFVAGFVGTSNILSGAGRRGHRRVVTGTFTVRPEKIHLEEPSAATPVGSLSAARATSVTSCTSARTRSTTWRSTSGGELAVIKQNVATSSMEALALKGTAVRLVWEGRHTLAIEAGAPDSPRSPSPDGGA